MPCSVAAGYKLLAGSDYLHLQGEVSEVLKNVGILQQHYMASQARRPQFESSPH
jgi:hypothetical protein